MLVVTAILKYLEIGQQFEVRLNTDNGGIQTLI